MKRLNNLYYSKRIKELLAELQTAGTTLVVAPMGYGKTLAVQYFLQEQERCGKRVLRQSIYGAGAESFWQGVCHSWQNTELGAALLQQSLPADANAKTLVLELFRQLLPQEPVYWFIDDLHLLESSEAIDFLFALSKAGFADLHLLLVSRGQIFDGSRLLELGRKVFCLDKHDLALQRDELAEYSSRCGLKLTAQQLDALHEACEGWFSVTYLNFLNYDRYQRFCLDTGSVYEMIANVLLRPLPSEQQRLLLLMGQPEEFTPEQVAYAYGTSCRESVGRLLECNAFIIRLANGRLRCHHMLKQATRHAFGLLPEAEQQIYFRRLGQWYAQQKEYEEALDWLYRGRDFDGLLAAVQQLRDWSMHPQHRQHLFDWLCECPPEILWQYPQAVLIIMRRMFSLNMVPEMLQVKEWYVTALERNTALSQRERDNYYGELEVILSFLAFNSITGMSEHHRRAYKLLSGAPQTLSKQGIWTFGAPSVLGLYLRTGCSLRQTVEDMQECMPPYYLLSGWHGAGAAELTEAEALLLQGRIDEMDMPLQKAYYQAEKHGQECITICCDFLEMQRDLFRGVYSSKAEAYSRHQWQLQPWKQSMLLNTADMCAGFYYALLGKPEYIPSWLTDGNGQQPSVLYPARPCRNYISAQCLLAQGQYTELLVRWSDWEQECRPYSNFLCLLYLQVQRAAAFAGRGDVTSCRASLKQALAMAEADKLVLPLAQNIALLRPYLEQEAQGEYSAAAAAALHLGQQMEAGRGQIMSARFAEAGLQELTEQELQIAQLAAARHTNREIAQRLSLSEGTIKQYLNKIFAKLQIDAAAKNKRHQLERFFSNS